MKTLNLESLSFILYKKYKILINHFDNEIPYFVFLNQRVDGRGYMKQLNINLIFYQQKSLNNECHSLYQEYDKGI